MMLPVSGQNLTFCSKVKFYQTFLKGYLYADLKLVHDKDRRYVFADDNFNDITTTWKISKQEEYIFIINDFYDECLYPINPSKKIATWIPGCLFNLQQT